MRSAGSVLHILFMAAKSSAARGPSPRESGSCRLAGGSLAQAILNTVRMPLLALNQGLRVMYANGSFYRDFRLARGDLEGHELCKLAGWNRGSLRELLHDVFSKQRELSDYELEAQFPQLGKRILLLNGSRIPYAARRGSLIVLAIEDVTARRASEDALQEKLAAMQRSNADLEQFALAAAHDLQEPLRMIGSFTQLLAKEQVGKLGTESDESISYIVDGVKRMQALVNDLLGYARLAAHPPQLQEIDSETVLRDTLDDLAMCITETGTTVTHDPLPHLLADPIQLHEQFQNLVANALKFRGADAATIHVSARRKAGFWVFSVRDNGIGVPSEFQQVIFEVFKRLHSRTKFDGTGMGLAICRKIVEQHGGRIWVESQPGRGSTFYFTVAAGEKG